MSNALKAFLNSRKGLLFIVGMIVATVLFMMGHITAEVYMDAVVFLIGILSGTIAIEDAAKKLLNGGELSDFLGLELNELDE